jgi:hypothetical protein
LPDHSFILSDEYQKLLNRENPGADLFYLTS